MWFGNKKAVEGAAEQLGLGTRANVEAWTCNLSAFRAAKPYCRRKEKETPPSFFGSMNGGFAGAFSYITSRQFIRISRPLLAECK
jgi:hypothetical protein